MPISILTVKRLIAEGGGTGGIPATASYALTAQTLLGSVVSASYASNASTANTATTASYALVAQSLLGSITSASYAATASYLNFDPNIFKQTGSYWNTTRNIGITGSLQMNFDGASNYFSVVVSGQETVKINTQGTLQLMSQSTAPTAVVGGIFYSSSDAFYLGFNV